MEHAVPRENYSIAVWIIKPGREGEFISAWKDFASWTAMAGMGAVEGTLMQDITEPRRFFCFWPFESEEGIRRWKNDPKFREFMMRMRAYCEDCQHSISKTIDYVEEEPPV